MSRERLIDVSRDIVEREGAEQLTIRRIAETVDRTQPAVYAQFSSKDDILAAVAVEGFIALAAQLEKAARAGDDDRLGAIAKAYVQFGLKRPQLYKVMFVDPAVIPFAQPSTPAAARAAFGSLYDAVVEASGLDASRAETATEVMWAALHGFVMLSVTERFRPGNALHRSRTTALVESIRAMVKGG